MTYGGEGFLNALNIYPDVIDSAVRKCERALLTADFSELDVKAIEDRISEAFANGELDYGNITNSLIAKGFEVTIDALKERFPEEDFDYYVNGYGYDSHLYVNGQEFYDGDNIRMLLANYYPEKELNSDLNVKETTTVEGGSVTFVLETDDYDDLTTLLERGGVPTSVIDETLAETSKADLVINATREDDDIKLKITATQENGEKWSCMPPLSSTELNQLLSVTNDKYEKALKNSKSRNVKERD